MPKIVLMCGSHPRHLAIANVLWQAKKLAALVIEEREAFIPSPPERLSERDKKNFIHHFQKRDECEKKYFGDIDSVPITNDVPTLRTAKENLNSAQTCDFISQHADGNLLITYGVHKIDNNLISIFYDRAFNIHGGLSPWFKGNTTLFWPFYFLKPNWAGMTIHRLTEKLDAGEILHHSIPALEHGDCMHDVACKAVSQVSKDLISILEKLDQGAKIQTHDMKKAGKLFENSDWTPETLRVIYELFNDRIVDMFLSGEIDSPPPKTISFFECIQTKY